MNLLSWRIQGPGVRYDLVSGLIGALRPDGGAAAASCPADDVTTATFEDGRPVPAPGVGYYYFVRAEKPPTCGTGSYGLASSGAVRLPGADCP